MIDFLSIFYKIYNAYLKQNKKKFTFRRKFEAISRDKPHSINIKPYHLPNLNPLR